MKRIFSISLLSLLLLFAFTLVGQAKSQEADRTLTVYIQAPKTGGTLTFTSPVSKTVSVKPSTKVVMEDYLYIGGVLLNFNVNGVSGKTITILCSEANYTKTITKASHVQEFIPVPSATDCTISIVFNN